MPIAVKIYERALPQDVIMPIGAYKNSKLRDISDDYLKWILNKEFIYFNFPNLAKQLEDEFQRRKKERSKLRRLQKKALSTSTGARKQM
jgi:hypothetical protein